MKKHFTTGRILIYLLLLTGVGASLVGVSDARYSTVVRGGASATVAAVALDITGNRTSIDLSSHLQDMSPGSERNLVFSVSNQKNGAVSQVTQEYSITVGSTGNLPLTFHLAPKLRLLRGSASMKPERPTVKTWFGPAVFSPAQSPLSRIHIRSLSAGPLLSLTPLTPVKLIW